MGCINSKKDLSDINTNIYRVVNVNADGIALWSGQLEITPKELTLHRKGKEPTKWSLQHLRRYGYDADLFTFEAGRRCTTGEGIYAFKCRRAESLFHTLQSYIQGIALSDDSTHQVGDFVSNSNSSNGPINQGRPSRPIGFCGRPSSLVSQTQSGNYVIPSNRPNSAGSNGAINGDFLSTESNYLEPTPIRNSNAGMRHSSGMRLSSVGSGPLSPEPNSPSSPNSFTIILEVTQLNQQQQNTYQNSNLYQEFPLKSHENNNNLFSRKLSLDIPPQEPAPAISVVQHSSTISENNFSSSPNQLSPIDNDSSHMYVNVTPGEIEGVLRSGTPTVASTNQVNFPFTRITSTYSIDPSIRCYENLELGEFRPTTTQPRYSKPDIFAKVDLPTHSLIAGEKSDPATPITKEESRKVNYIVLDLDQSPSSTTVVTCSTSSFVTTVTTNTTASTTNTAALQNTVNNNNNNNNNTIIKAITPTISTGPNLLPPESPKKSSLGYATIDFNKTVALSNTTASLEMDSEGSRKTRHSSTAAARHSNSISD